MKVSLKKILLLAGAFLGLVSFIMVFVSPLKILVKSFFGETTYKLSMGDIYFNSTVSFEGFSLGSSNGAILPFIGFILILLGSVALGLLAFDIINQKKLGYFTYIILLPILLGIIFVFLAKSSWVSANNLKDYSEYLHLGAGPILGGIFGFLSLATGALGIYLKK